MLASERAAAWAEVLTSCGDRWPDNVPVDADRVDHQRGEVVLDGYLLRRGHYTRHGGCRPWTVELAGGG